MSNWFFVVAKGDSGKRLDRVITEFLNETCSRTHIKNLINRGHVKVNDKEVKPRYIVREKDRIWIDLILPGVMKAVEPEPIPLEIIYEDEVLLVVNKPYGMVVHPGAGNKKGTMAGALLNHCGAIADTGDRLRPGIVHRLDKDTSGVIVVAKNDRAMRSLSKQFRNRTVSKFYLAVVKGVVEYDNGEVGAPISRSVVDRKKMIVEPASGREAKTIYHVLKRYEKYTLLRIKLETGRTHQIRVHMQYLGHPVAGDRIYGRSTEVPRQLLHAEKIKFTHPGTLKNVEFEAPMPEDMRDFIEKLEK
jgi:23S rRNA pseudouridine1911/1915/1917 synthase